MLCFIQIQNSFSFSVSHLWLWIETPGEAGHGGTYLIIPAFGRLRQVYLCGFKTGLIYELSKVSQAYIVRSCLKLFFLPTHKRKKKKRKQRNTAVRWILRVAAMIDCIIGEKRSFYAYFTHCLQLPLLECIGRECIGAVWNCTFYANSSWCFELS